jgi:dTDP-L-rhamnose 4-epimerase
MMKKTVLITGGSGFIGSRLALRLLAAGHEVRVLDALIPQIHGDDPEASPLYQSIQGKVDFHRGCITDRSLLAHCLQGVDAVVHLAAETGTGQSMYEIQRYVDVNVGGTGILLDLLANAQHQVRKLVVASSRAIYGEGKYRCATHGVVYPEQRTAEDMEQGLFSPRCPVCGAFVEVEATDESTPAKPSSIYGITKLNQEQMVLTVGRALGIPSLAFRYQNVYGPGQSLSNPYTGILSIFSTRIRNGKSINIFEDGRESRDFVFVDDVVAATMLGVEHEGWVNDVFNVGSGVPTDVNAIVRMLQAAFGKEVPTAVSGQFRLGDICHNFADLGKIERVLGFVPRVGIEQGISRFVDWVKEQQGGKDAYEESLRELAEKGLFKGNAS